MKTKLVTFVMLAAFACTGASSAFAAEKKKPADDGGSAKSDDGKSSKLDELKKRFQERYPAIKELKAKGVVGETDKGYLEWVEKKDASSADLVKEENDDRTQLYKEVAKKENTDQETVAKHAAQRNFDKAKAGDYLQVDGKWHKKEG